MLPKAEQELYDKARISKDMRNSCFIWTSVMAAGALASWLLTTYAFIPAYIIWIILFFRDFHIDARKAYKKYLLETMPGKALTDDFIESLLPWSKTIPEYVKVPENREK